MVDNQEMSLPPSHDSREDNLNPVLRLLKENLDEISGDDADLKKESSSGKKLGSNTIVIGQPAKSVRFGQLSLTSSSSHQKDWRQREPLERTSDEQE